MTRLQRFARSVSLLTVLVAAGAAFATPFRGEEGIGGSDSAVVTVGGVAAQLGVKVTRGDEEFGVFAQFTGTLVQPEKLAAYGIKGMHAGARVVAARVAPDRVYVEADELEPPNRASARLRMDADGNLVRPPIS